MKLTCVLVRNVSYMGMNLLRTVGLVQFSLPEHHRYNVKWAVTHGNNKSSVLSGLSFITSEGPLEYAAYPDFGSYVCALQTCRDVHQEAG